MKRSYLIAAALALASLPGCGSRPAPAGDPGVPGATAGWSPAEAALSVAEAAARAAAQPGANRQAVIDAALQAAITQAALVAPSLAVDPAWIEAVRLAISLGVSLSKSETPGPSLKDRVYAVTLPRIEAEAQK